MNSTFFFLHIHNFLLFQHFTIRWTELRLFGLIFREVLQFPVNLDKYGAKYDWFNKANTKKNDLSLVFPMTQ